MRKSILALTILCFFITSVFGTCPVYAQPAPPQAGEFHLPVPGVRVNLSPEFNPPILKGIKVHPDNPFQFDFILDQGDSLSSSVIASEAKQSQQEQLKQQATKLIKYFLASLTIPEKDLWVNLSPYEKDRIIPQSFGLTEMGRDLLAEDYMLKQITASLIYPEDEIGKKFWKRIYAEAQKKFGSTNIPVNTFNKVWILPEKAVVYENAKAGTAYVVESKLKVMLEEDYLSMSKHADVGQAPNINRLGSQIIREIVIPELTKEVNEGKNFAQLRQVYNSLILATWYKKKIKDSILARVYEDKKKVAGVGYESRNDVEAIYQRYLQAFKKGVYNYIKEEQDPLTQQPIPRKYFSGGLVLNMAMMSTTTDGAMIQPSGRTFFTVNAGLASVQSSNRAMTSMPGKYQGIQMQDSGNPGSVFKENAHNDSPPMKRPDQNPDYVRNVARMFFVKTDVPLTVPRDLKGANIAIINPGRNANEIIAFVQAFPEINSITIIDEHESVFSLIDNELANYFANGNRLPKINGYNVGVLDMPQELSGLFDLVFSHYAMDHSSPDRQHRAAEEMQRIVKPGGAVVISGVWKDGNWLKKLFPRGFKVYSLTDDIVFPMWMGVKSPDRAMKADVFNQFINTKWGIRQLLRGGVIKQPDWFVIFKRDKRSSQLSPRVIDRAYREEFTDPNDVKDFRVMADDIVSGKIALPVVYKPNRNALGRGIFFIHQMKGQNLAITFTHTGDPYQDPVILYFSHQGIVPKIKRDENAMIFVINTSWPNAADILEGLWRTVSFNNNIYDTGGMESFMDTFQLKGKSYESRFIFRGNLGTGEFLPTPDDPFQEIPWQQHTRIGNSPLFSNFIWREGAQIVYRGEERYADILKFYNIDPGRWKEFETHVYQLIEHDFKLMASRLNVRGIRLDQDIRGNFDLKWQAPEKEGDFPVPVLIETNMIYEQDSSQLDRKPGDRAMRAFEDRHSYTRVDTSSSEAGELYRDILLQTYQGRKEYISGFIQAIKDSNPEVPLSFQNFDQAWSSSAEKPQDKIPQGFLKDEAGKYWILKQKKKIPLNVKMISSSHIIKKISSPRVLLQRAKDWISGAPTAFKNIKKRELLAYLLFMGRANIAEIRPVSIDEAGDLGISPQKADDYYLTRVVTQRNMDRLPHTKKAQAFSALFVAHIFLRKWDQHPDNFSYVDNNIPVSIDEDLTNQYTKAPDVNQSFIEGFLAHAIYLILNEFLSPGNKESINILRDSNLGIAYVRNEGLDKEYIAQTIKAIKSIDNVEVLAQEAGYTGQELKDVVAFIKNNQQTIGADVDYVWYRLTGEETNFKDLDKASLAQRPEDRAMKTTRGGIDLTPANMNVEVKKEIATSPSAPRNDTGKRARNDTLEGIRFHLDPAQLAQLQNAPGFVPVIINIRPLNDLKSFLGVDV